jgi:hypothetical protein
MRILTRINRCVAISIVLAFFWKCQSVPLYKATPERIDLNNVRMITPAESSKAENEEEPATKAGVKISEKPWVNLEYTEKGKASIQAELYCNESGLNIIEEIKKGTILEHLIIVKNSAGETIASQPINFQAFEITPNALGNKSIQTAEPRRYTENETVPQTIELDPKKVPGVGESVSIYLELTYVNPFLDGACAKENKSCENDKELLFERIAEKNRNQLKRLKESYENGNFEKFEGLSSSEVESEKSFIREQVNRLNQSTETFSTKDFKPYTGKSMSYDANKYSYREWNLVSPPRFFKILNVIRNGKAVKEASVVPEPEELPTLPKEIEKEKVIKETKPAESKPNTKRRKKLIIFP